MIFAIISVFVSDNMLYNPYVKGMSETSKYVKKIYGYVFSKFYGINRTNRRRLPPLVKR